MSKSNLDDILGTSADDKDETQVIEAKNDKSSVDESKATKSTAKKEVKSADDKKDDSKEAAKLEEASKTVTEKTQESKAEDGQKSAETKNQDKTVPSSADESNKAEEDKKPESDDKVATIQENEDETETSIKSQSEFPYSLALNRPVVIYRGASLNLASKSFGGTVRILGEDVDGFTPVEYVRSEIGLRKGYILTREVEEVWRSLK